MNQIAVRKSNLEVELDAYEPQLAAALPSHISVDKFKRVVVTAINRNPDLYTKGDKRALFNACVQCASDGLLPDGREAALVMFKGKPAYLPMVAGVIKRMRNSGEVIAVDSQVVHQNDHFDYQLGDDARITHKPTLGEPGKLIGAYAIITLASGERLREVMSVAQIDKVRAVSRAGRDDSPWNQWYGEMARKTVLKRCAKRAPTTPDLERLLSRDDVPEPAAAAIAPPRPTRHAFLAAVETEPTVETEVDPAAAGHEDLDERFRQTVAHDEDGVIADTSAPSPSPLSHDERPAEATQATPQAEGAGAAAEPPATDWPALAQQLKEGADDQKTVPELDEYYGAQRASIAALEKGDAKLGGDVMAHLNARRKKLLAEKAGGGK